MSSRPLSSVRLIQSVAGALFVGVSALSLLLLQRRLGGHLDQPLPVWVVLPVLLIAVGSVWAFRATSILNRASTAFTGVFGSSVLVCLLIALLQPGAAPGSVFLGWSIVIVSEVTWWWLFWHGEHPRWHAPIGQPISTTPSGLALPDSPAPSAEDIVPVVQPEGEAAEPVSELSELERRLLSQLPDDEGSDASDDDEVEFEEEATDTSLDAQATQQLQRRTGEAGEDCMTGLLRARFHPQEKLQSLHVAFCPPFETQPNVEVHAVEGAGVSIKVAESHSYGARFEVRVEETRDTDQESVVYFDARVPASS